MTSVQPIIVIGMHRSGTTMIVELLEQLGLFMGQHYNNHGEALLFFRINRWLLNSSNASWDHPEGISFLLENPEARELSASYIKRFLNSPLLNQYLGWKQYWKYKQLSNLDFPWGWKDPVNTYTLPIWLDFFPNAKIIHIRRHGIDVANSLYVRSVKRDKTLDQNLNAYVSKPWFWLYPKWFVRTNWSTVRCQTIEGGFSLWETYLAHAQQTVANIDNEVLELKFEDFLMSPASTLEMLSNFCELDTTSDLIKQVSKDVDASRAYAFRKNEKLQKYNSIFSDRLKVFNYD